MCPPEFGLERNRKCCASRKAARRECCHDAHMPSAAQCPPRRDPWLASFCRRHHHQPLALRASCHRLLRQHLTYSFLEGSFGGMIVHRQRGFLCCMITLVPIDLSPYFTMDQYRYVQKVMVLVFCSTAPMFPHQCLDIEGDPGGGTGGPRMSAVARHRANGKRGLQYSPRRGGRGPWGKSCPVPKNGRAHSVKGGICSAGVHLLVLMGARTLRINATL